MIISLLLKLRNLQKIEVDQFSCYIIPHKFDILASNLIRDIYKNQI